MPNNFIQLVRNHHELSLRIQRRDVVFRHQYADSSAKMPFLASRHPEKLAETYLRLNNGVIDEDDALDEITSVMERYYGMPYPLDN